MTITEYFKDRKYPGRVIVAGSTPEGKSVLCYAIMGRSENSRNRIFRFEEDGTLKAAPYDEEKVEDPSLIIYNAMRQLGALTILTNGSQTDLIHDTLASGGSLNDAMWKMEYEPDAPNYTPRISCVLDEETRAYRLAIARREGDGCARIVWNYPAQNGIGHAIHTYLESSSDILAPFTKDPERLSLPSTLEETANEMWDALDSDNKISLFVQVGDEMTIINKNGADGE